MSPGRILAFVLVNVLSLTGADAAAWLSNFDTARANAAANNRPILMSFTGSDWCPACQQMRSTVFSSPDFDAFADAQLVLMEVDFPRSRPLAALHLQANQQLGRKYQVQSYPTFILVNPTGEVLGPVQATTSPRQFMAMIQSVIVNARNSGKLARPEIVQVPPPVESRPEPVRDLPLFSGAATQPLPVYTNLVLKNISGAPSRRFALINSETLKAGDEAWMKINVGKVKVSCVEVREKSVVVRVNGEVIPRELLLTDR